MTSSRRARGSYSTYAEQPPKWRKQPKPKPDHTPSLDNVRKAMAEAEAKEAARPPCPKEADHADHPKDYMGHSSWAREKRNTGWTQRECRGCGRPKIWDPPKRET